MRQIAKILVLLTIAVAASWTSVSQGALLGLPRATFRIQPEKISFDIPPLPSIPHTQFCLLYRGNCAPPDTNLRDSPVAVAPEVGNKIDSANHAVDHGPAVEISTDNVSERTDVGFTATTQAPIAYTWFCLEDLDAWAPHGVNLGDRPIALSPERSDLKPVEHETDREVDRSIASELAPGNPELAKISFGKPELPPIGHTRFCLKYPDDCAVQGSESGGAAMVLTLERWHELNTVNREVNRDIIPQITSGDGLTEEWTIAPQAGDCKDYAITKRHELLARGWPSQALLLAEVVVPDGEHHLILVVRTKDVDLVLDNLNANIRPAAMTYGQYKWVRIELPQNPKFWASMRQPELVRTARAFD